MAGSHARGFIRSRAKRGRREVGTNILLNCPSEIDYAINLKAFPQTPTGVCEDADLCIPIDYMRSREMFQCLTAKVNLSRQGNGHSSPFVLEFLAHLQVQSPCRSVTY